MSHKAKRNDTIKGKTVPKASGQRQQRETGKERESYRRETGEGEGEEVG